MRKSAVIVLLLICTLELFSQKKENIPNHSPKTAALYSAVVPGLGQVYNQKYWKLPIIYGAGGFLVYKVVESNKEFKLYKTAQEYFKNGSDYYSLFPPEDSSRIDPLLFKGKRDDFHGERDDFIFYCTLVYALNIVDAVIDAHLFEFNVNDDLSLEIKPNIIYSENNLVLGNQITLNF